MIKALVLGFLVNTIGVYGVPVFTSLLSLPLTFFAIPSYLFIYWIFFSGSWGHKASQGARKKYFRDKALTSAQWRWSLLATGFLVNFFQAAMVVTFRIIKFPAEQFTSVNGLDVLPVGIAWVAIVFSALSAGLGEESGFRGYGQVPWKYATDPVLRS